MKCTRFAPGDVRSSLATLEQAWHDAAPELPFVFVFMDTAIEQQYRSETRWASIVRYASLLAIAIACLGLFGLATLASVKRAKEISIRKVLGASAASIVAMLSKEFAWLMLVALVVAMPLGYIATQRWLELFAYRIELSWWIFLMAGLAVLGIALLTVSYQTIKTVLANPVESLRYE